MKNPNRYPGLSPFTEEQNNLFFGRGNDIEKLVQLISIKKAVLLVSKSGVGKSSIISAGIVPELENKENYLISRIRFNNYNENNLATPKLIFEHHLKNISDIDNFMLKIENDNISIWQYAKSLQISNPHKKNILLIFDQFEELFTYPEGIDLFTQELSHLLDNKTPNGFLNNLESLLINNPSLFSDEELEFLNADPGVKVLISIRSDKLSNVNRLSNFIPGILKNIYELKPLSRDQAQAAIEQPAIIEGNYISLPFKYNPEALNKILNYLCNNPESSAEPFQLQILCQHIEDEVIVKGGKRNVEGSDIQNIENIYLNYYNFSINKIKDADDLLKVRRLLEEGMIFEEEERRLTVYSGQIHAEYGITDELLDALIDIRLIRAEPTPDGGLYYEITHDTLVRPILKSKRERVEEEQRLEEIRLAEQKFIEEKKKTAERFQRRIRILLLFFLAFIGIGGGIFSYSLYQTNNELKAINKEINQALSELSNVIPISKDDEGEPLALSVQIQKSNQVVSTANEKSRLLKNVSSELNKYASENDIILPPELIEIIEGFEKDLKILDENQTLLTENSTPKSMEATGESIKRVIPSDTRILAEKRIKGSYETNIITLAELSSYNVIPWGVPFQTRLFVSFSSDKVKPSFKSSIGKISREGRFAKLIIDTDTMKFTGNEVRKSFDYKAFVPKVDGIGYETLSQKGQFIVRKPGITITSAAVQNLYRDCANDLNIASPALGNYYNPRVSVSKGEIKPNESSNEKFRIIPTGRKCAIKVENIVDGKATTLDIISFNVINPPKPSINMRVDGREISGPTAISRSSRIEVRLELDEEFKTQLPQDAKYGITRYTVKSQEGMGSPRTIHIGTISGEASSPKRLSLGGRISDLRPGTNIFIELEGIYRVNFQNRMINIPYNRREMITTLILRS